MKQLEAMNLAMDWVSSRPNMREISAGKMESILYAAIAELEVQNVEPVGIKLNDPVLGNPIVWFAEIEPGAKIFTHPAPAKHPFDSEQWQPIETAPKFSDEIDIWASGMRFTGCTYGRPTYGKGLGWLYESHQDIDSTVYGIVKNPTHWMKIAKAPGTSEKLCNVSADARVPMTQQEINKGNIYRNAGSVFTDGVRYAEAHHGIGVARDETCLCQKNSGGVLCDSCPAWDYEKGEAK